ncbi:HAD-superfamily hydrolase [Thecamonas trahens ATCC 50062]|uniref:HAD-superfamily hydrolase n=1 Tax=Thecamonas trahens ATCC 50062 TaxID=461836 RepID=A0A0L0DAG3_THETB|nr:HAD-superfamily hydrolase [Thecamonas trahens ATCC 50062]KNC48293.1 HAD-superfamily hydrolase [Thecamonas trahens ATCC 50062]|eukprot:XP_013758860.1 HAD-superfamily hydrolase [Thecamonas trahens ATCC 50062]
MVTLDFSDTLAYICASVGSHYGEAMATAEPSRLWWMRQPEVIALLDTAFFAAYKATDASLPNFGAEAGLDHHGWWWEVVSATFENGVHAAHDAGLVPDSLSAHAALGSINSLLINDGLFDHLVTHFTTSGAYAMYPDVEPALRELREIRLPATGARPILGVVTNMTSKVNDTLASLDLAKFFDFVVDSHSVKAPKPDPAIFAVAATRAADAAADLGLPWHDADSDDEVITALHVGDSMADYHGAIAAPGFSPLLIHRTDARKAVPPFVEKDCVIHTLDDLVTRLQALTEAR